MKQYHIPLLQLSEKKLSNFIIKVIFLGLLILTTTILLSGCNIPNQTPTLPSENSMASMVASTLQSMTQTMDFINSSTDNPVLTDIPFKISSTPSSEVSTLTPSSKGKITGLVCFTEVQPTNMVVYFQNSANNLVVEYPVSVSNYQAPYSTELDPGTYIAYAWTLDFSIGGTYSVCGAASACGDATPKAFTVIAGQTIEKIDICDWSHGPFDVPYPPGFQPESKFGIISGGIYGYPYGNLPQLTIVAFNKNTGYWYWVGTAAGQSYFTMNDIPAGSYQVVAYDGSGHAGSTSVIVEVKGGQTTNADLNNWAGTFPANPLK